MIACRGRQCGAGADFPVRVVRLAKKAAEQAQAHAHAAKGLPEPVFAGRRLLGALGVLAARLGTASFGALRPWSWRREVQPSTRDWPRREKMWSVRLAGPQPL
jgi:hypothetical protein